MKIIYYEDVDALRITLKSETPEVAGEEMAEGIVVHADDEGEVYTLEIQSRASERVDLSGLEVSGLTVR